MSGQFARWIEARCLEFMLTCTRVIIIYGLYVCRQGYVVIPVTLFLLGLQQIRLQHGYMRTGIAVAQTNFLNLTNNINNAF